MVDLHFLIMYIYIIRKTIIISTFQFDEQIEVRFPYKWDKCISLWTVYWSDCEADHFHFLTAMPFYTIIKPSFYRWLDNIWGVTVQYISTPAITVQKQLLIPNFTMKNILKSSTCENIKTLPVVLYLGCLIHTCTVIQQGTCLCEPALYIRLKL